MLFLKEEEKIKKSCLTNVSPYSILPQVFHVIHGLWFEAIQKLLTFAVVCPQEEKNITHMKPPIYIIKLNMSYNTKNDYITLLLYYHSESKTDIQDQFIYDLSLYNGAN